MATNYTANYGLSQWEPGDNFIRSEFNADNAKMDAELKRVDEMAQESHRYLPFVGYTLYNLVLQNYYQDKVTGVRRAMLFDGFLRGGIIASSTGGVTVENNALCLSGVGAVGSITSPCISVETEWERSICWVRHSGGTIYPVLNGVEMPFSTASGSASMQGDRCIEREFKLVAPGDGSVVFTLRLDCLNSPSMKVYDYGVIFL